MFDSVHPVDRLVALISFEFDIFADNLADVSLVIDNKYLSHLLIIAAFHTYLVHLYLTNFHIKM